MTGIGAAIFRARVTAGSVCVVFGAGGVGLSVVLGCVLAGARTFVTVDPVPFKRELALDLGATHAIDPNDDDPRTVARGLTDGRGADYAFNAASTPVLVRTGFETIRQGGTLVCVGLGPEGADTSLPANELVRHEKVVTGTMYGSCRPQIDMPFVIDLFMEGRLPLERLVSKTYELDAINEAFADMNAGRVARGVIALV
jgi:Zn-dependent alcohol dehydrogenase